MKQTIKNFGKALLGLVMPVKHQPLSDGWIKQNDKEIKKSVKNSAFRPRWMSKLNTTVKNEFKKDKKEEVPYNAHIKKMRVEIMTKNMTTEQKLKDALEKLGSQPGYGKWEKSDKEYIKCDGTGTITHKDDIYYYPLSNLHLSKDFFSKVTIEQLERDFDINNDNDFRAWFLYHLLKMREE